MNDTSCPALWSRWCWSPIPAVSAQRQCYAQDKPPVHCRAAQRDNLRAANWPNVHFFGMWEKGRENPLPSCLHTDADDQSTTVNNQQLIGLLMGGCLGAAPSLRKNKKTKNLFPTKASCLLAEVPKVFTFFP